TSEKPPMMVPSEPSPWSPPRETRKLKAEYGLLRNVGMVSLLASGLGVGRPLADAEDHELGRLHRRHADEADQAPVVVVVLGHRRAVAADEERLLGLVAQQRAVAPQGEQEVLDGAADVVPQAAVVGLEHRPLGAAVDRVLEIQEEPDDVDVLPLRIGAHGARPPHPVAAALEEA